MSKSNRRRGATFSACTFLALAWALVACVVVQTFLAGMAVFGDPAHWQSHRTLVHFFEFVPLLMLGFALAGRLPSLLRWSSLILFALIFAQYATAHAPGAGALHPVIALVLFWFSFFVATKAWKFVFDAEAGTGKAE